MPDDTPILVLTTTSKMDDAKWIARALVDQRLAACVNILGGIQSIYRWQGAVMEDGEQLLLIKTTSGRLDELRARVFELHPYEVPELVVIEPAHVAEPYRSWLVESTNAEAGG